MRMPGNIKKYFWEVNLDDLKLKKDFHYIISRLLEYGRPEAVRWLLKTYPKRVIKQVAKTSRSISNRTKAFWENI